MQKGSKLEGKTVLITGGARRIGRAIALRLADEKMHIVIHYHKSEKESDQIIIDLKQKGVRAWKIQADLSDIKNCESFFSGLNQKIPKIDYLINNASVFSYSNLPSLNKNELYHILNINSIAPFELSKQFALQAKEGVIINFLDSRITRYDLKRTAYQLSKNFLYDLTKMLAIEYAPDIRVNGIAPGLILPPEGEDFSYLEKLKSLNLLNTYGSLNNITDTVLFLLKNNFITGEVIFVDGGQSLKGIAHERKKT